jgi:hypothetical protein
MNTPTEVIVLESDHRRIAYAWMLGQDCLDLNGSLALPIAQRAMLSRFVLKISSARVDLRERVMNGSVPGFCGTKTMTMN